MSRIRYILKAIPGESSEFTLYKKIDQENRSTLFSYNIKPAKVSILDKEINNGSDNKYALLEEIEYPTKLKSKYDYEPPTTGNFGNTGVKQYYRVNVTTDIVINKNKNFKFRNQETYKYEKDYSGYGEYENIKDQSRWSYLYPEHLPNKFTYTTTITNSKQITTSYKFNNKHLLINVQDRSRLSLLSDKTTIYDPNNKLPLQVTNTLYNDKNANEFIEKVENFEYDDKGYADLIGYWGVQAERSTKLNSDGESYKIPNNDEYKITKEYDSTYHYLICNTYKRDKDTTIVENYEPHIDRKSIRYARIYENGTPKSQTEFSYDSFGNITEEKKYKNNFIEYEAIKYSYIDDRRPNFNGAYLTKQYVENVKDADDNDLGQNIQTFQYYDDGSIFQKKDGLNNITTFVYDKLGRIETQTNPDLNIKEIDYNDNENTVEITDENRNKFKVVYDKFGNIEYEQDVTKGEKIKEYEYDSLCRLEKEFTYQEKSLKKGNLTEYIYYDDGRLWEKKVTDLSSNKVISQELLEYQDADTGYSSITKTIKGDPNSPDIRSVSYINKTGQVGVQARMHNKGFYVDSFKYDYLGNKTQEKSSKAHEENINLKYTTKYEYDFANRPIKQYNADGEFTTTKYDDFGRVKTVTDIAGNKAPQEYSTTFEYDILGRKIKETIPFEKVNGNIYYSINKFYYDQNGNLIKQKNNKNKIGSPESYDQTTYDYNNRNMLTMVTTYNNGKPENYTQYFYDAVGNKLRMYTALSKPLTINGLDNVQPNEDNEYSVTKYQYNQFGNLLNRIDPLGKSESYIYDLQGNVTQKIDRNKSTITNEYDGLNRLKTTSTSTLDGKGNTSTSYDYTLTGQRKTMISDGKTIEYSYDDVGRLTTEKDNSINTIKTYDYDASNNRKFVILEKDGQTKSRIGYIYNIFNRLETVFCNGHKIATYTYDLNGNRDTLAYSNGNNVKYDYNLVNKLKQLTNKNGNNVLSNYSYEYYLDGKIAAENETVNGKSKNYVYDGLGRLDSETKTGKDPVKYNYDDNNNRNKMQIPTNWSDFQNSFKDTIYKYNGFNELTNVTIDKTNVSYSYNGDGLRTSKTVDGKTTTHILDGQNVAAEVDADGKFTEYIRGVNLIASLDGNDIKFYLYNSHGDVVHLTDSKGNVVKNYNYDAFGNEEKIDANDKNPFRYGGEYWDSETGFYYLRARMYDPKIGRFINEDSFPGYDDDPLSLNNYTYCLNNPIIMVDPSGFDSYILYDDTAKSGDGNRKFIDEAKIRKDQLAKKYGTKVWLIDVRNAKAFKDKWNSKVGFDGDGNSVTIDEVVIIVHGSADGKKGSGVGYMYFESDKSRIAAEDGAIRNSKKDILISDLNSKSMKSIYFSSCNSGNPDIKNTAAAFDKRMSTQEIVAWDGGTIFNYGTEQLEAGAYGGWYKENRRQHTYYKYVDKTWYGEPTRKRQGKVRTLHPAGDTYDFHYRG